MRHLILTIVFTVACSQALYAADGKPAPGKQVEQSFLAKGTKKPVRYLLFLPDGYDAQSKKTWPMIFFLHGRGESGTDLNLVKKWGPPKIVETNAKFPFIVVSPQCPWEDQWKSDTQQELLAKLLDDVQKRHRIDTSRIYLTGLSMGGYGTWSLATRHPSRFAAAVPICGGGDPQAAAKLKNVPIWVFHGDKDGAVPFKKSQDMVAAIRKAGGTKVRFTTLEHFGHNSWSAAYNSPELYNWLLKHKTTAAK